MKRDFEAAAKLEEQFKRAAEEAQVLKEEQKKVEKEKLQIAAMAASQKKQTEDAVSCPLFLLRDCDHAVRDIL